MIDVTTELAMEANDKAAQIARLKDDNAKLRELVDYMTPIAWYEASERERDRMRELGVDA